MPADIWEEIDKLWRWVRRIRESPPVPAWKDINLGAAQLSLPASSQPGVDSFLDELGADTGIETYAFDNGEKIHGEFEIQHDYQEGTDITFHVHFQGITAPTGTDYVKWDLTYTIARTGATLDPTTTISVECAVDTQYEFVICAFAAIDGTSLKIADQFLFTLSRGTAAANDYAGDALLATAGLHYKVNGFGSRGIITK